MTHPDITPAPRKHLYAPGTFTTAGAADIDLTRHHGQGNGLRVHLTYIVAVSLVALASLVVAIALATARMQ
ncbi:MAG: hypothetical protein WB471_02290 [Nocardioides sp.]